MNNDKNEILVTLNDTYAESKSLEEKSQIIEQQMIELERFKEVLNDLEKTHDEEILAQIGKGVYAKSKLIDDKFFIEVGAGVFVRKDLEETKEVVVLPKGMTLIKNSSELKKLKKGSKTWKDSDGKLYLLK